MTAAGSGRGTTAVPGRRARGRRWSGLALAAAALLAVGACGSSDASTVVPPPTDAQRADTVPILQRAAQAQGICYGWRLQESYNDVVSVGSNLGDGVPVEDQERCPRWVEISAVVYYYSSNSELEDSASVEVNSSGDVAEYRIAAGLQRFGLDDKVFVDDPGWAITRAATMLPLLTAETGDASPAPVVTGGPPASVQALPDAGNDYWRDRRGFFIAGGVILLITVLLLVVGLVSRQRSRA
ncbi:hypothetical protein [Micromonospora echinofusca]|uniref:Uncharacterized protein n=1 Tax=Micromonospora echinofusca TaxID=47858 RepID=A0ABS3VRN9_MICEH|nr:hypothetical protein [Micromonospora echinofusca]MBO4207049.1 hypothetical protein [Micromonospora echinofusca]